MSLLPIPHGGSGEYYHLTFDLMKSMPPNYLARYCGFIPCPWVFAFLPDIEESVGLKSAIYVTIQKNTERKMFSAAEIQDAHGIEYCASLKRWAPLKSQKDIKAYHLRTGQNFDITEPAPVVWRHTHLLTPGTAPPHTVVISVIVPGRQGNLISIVWWQTWVMEYRNRYIRFVLHDDCITDAAV